MFPEVDPVLGPEMRSTGEVLGLAQDFGMAFYKAQDAARSALPAGGTVLLTVHERDRGERLAASARRFSELCFRLLATDGTRRFLAEHGVEALPVLKLHQGRPNILDEVKNGGIQIVVNTPGGKLGAADDSYIRKAAIRHRIPYFTTVAAAAAAAEGIAARKANDWQVRPLQEYHASIHPA